MKHTNPTLAAIKLRVFAAAMILPVMLAGCAGGEALTQQRLGKEFNTISASSLPTSAAETSNAAQSGKARSTNTPTNSSNDSAKRSPFTSEYLHPNSLQLSQPVNDFTNTLTPQEQQALNSKIAAIDSQGLLQIGVVMVDTTGDMSTFDYAMKVAQRWALGSAQYSNGLVILVAKKDRKMHILTGSDIEDKLTNKRVADIIDKQITPYFPQGQYAQGLSVGIDALANEMRR